MGRTIADALREEGRAEGRVEGREQGRDEGRAEGRREALRQTLRDVMENRYGSLPAEVAQRIDALTDVQLMRNYIRQAMEVDELEAFSW